VEKNNTEKGIKPIPKGTKINPAIHADELVVKLETQALPLFIVK